MVQYVKKDKREKKYMKKNRNQKKARSRGKRPIIKEGVANQAIRFSNSEREEKERSNPIFDRQMMYKKV